MTNDSRTTINRTTDQSIKRPKSMSTMKRLVCGAAFVGALLIEPLLKTSGHSHGLGMSMGGPAYAQTMKPSERSALISETQALITKIKNVLAHRPRPMGAAKTQEIMKTLLTNLSKLTGSTPDRLYDRYFNNAQTLTKDTFNRYIKNVEQALDLMQRIQATTAVAKTAPVKPAAPAVKPPSQLASVVPIKGTPSGIVTKPLPSYEQSENLNLFLKGFSKAYGLDALEELKSSKFDDVARKIKSDGQILGAKEKLARGEKVVKNVKIQSGAKKAISDLIKAAENSTDALSAVSNYQELRQINAAIYVLSDAMNVVIEYGKAKGTNNPEYLRAKNTLILNFASTVLVDKNYTDALKNALDTMQGLIARDPSLKTLVSPRLSRWLFRNKLNDAKTNAGIRPNDDFVDLSKDVLKGSKEVLTSMVGFADEAIKLSKIQPTDPLLNTVNALIKHCKASVAKADAKQSARLAGALESAVTGLLTFNEQQLLLERIGRTNPGSSVYMTVKADFDLMKREFESEFGDPRWISPSPSTITDIALESLLALYPKEIVLLENTNYLWKFAALAATRGTSSAVELQGALEGAMKTYNNNTEALYAAANLKTKGFFSKVAINSGTSRWFSLQNLVDPRYLVFPKAESMYERRAETAPLIDVSSGHLLYMFNKTPKEIKRLNGMGYPIPDANLNKVRDAVMKSASSLSADYATRLKTDPAGLKKTNDPLIKGGNESLAFEIQELLKACPDIEKKVNMALILEAYRANDPATKRLLDRYTNRKNYVASKLKVYVQNSSQDLLNRSVPGASASPLLSYQLLTSAITSLKDAETAAGEWKISGGKRDTFRIESENFILLSETPNFMQGQKMYSDMELSVKLNKPLKEIFGNTKIHLMFSEVDQEPSVTSPMGVYYALSSGVQPGPERVARLSDGDMTFYLSKNGRLMDAKKVWRIHGYRVSNDDELTKFGYVVVTVKGAYTLGKERTGKIKEVPLINLAKVRDALQKAGKDGIQFLKYFDQVKTKGSLDIGTIGALDKSIKFRVNVPSEIGNDGSPIAVMAYVSEEK